MRTITLPKSASIPMGIAFLVSGVILAILGAGLVAGGEASIKKLD